MPERTVNLVRRAAPGRQGIWQGIRALREFTGAELARHTRRREDTVRTYLLGLVAAGYLTRANETSTSMVRRAQGPVLVVYTLVRDCGIEAPRVRRDGSRVRTGGMSERLWRTMKMLGEFDSTQLAAAASLTCGELEPAYANSYIIRLARAGYLRRVAGGRPHHPARYRFISVMNTGPEPPQIRLRAGVKQVFDPNTRRVMWPREGA